MNVSKQCEKKQMKGLYLRGLVKEGHVDLEDMRGLQNVSTSPGLRPSLSS